MSRNGSKGWKQKFKLLCFAAGYSNFIGELVSCVSAHTTPCFDSACSGRDALFQIQESTVTFYTLLLA